MLLQSQLKFKDNMLQVADLNLTEALDQGHNGVVQEVLVNGVDLKDSLAGINSNQEDQDGTNSSLIKVGGLDNNNLVIGINPLSHNHGNSKVVQQHLLLKVQDGINHNNSNHGNNHNKANGEGSLGVEHQLRNQLLLLLHRLNLLQQQTRLLVNLIILQHGLLTTNIVSSMAFKQSHPLPRLLHQRSQLPLLPRTQQLQLLLSLRLPRLLVVNQITLLNGRNITAHTTQATNNRLVGLLQLPLHSKRMSGKFGQRYVMLNEPCQMLYCILIARLLHSYCHVYIVACS